VSERGGAHILVVDDDTELGRFVVDLATDQGHIASSAQGPLEALDLLKARQFELMVTDIRMPGMDGLEFIRRARAADPHLAIVAITAFGSLETGLRALQAGAQDYLSKPFRSDELSAKIERVLERRARELESLRLRREVDEVLRNRNKG
jgi:DNA-binding response OmpR family regulator